MTRTRDLLWLDSRGGLAVGVGTLLLSRWLSELYRLPLAFVLVLAAANLTYGSFSFQLERRRPRPPALLHTLIAGNVIWGIGCFVAAWQLRDVASWIGLGALLFEGAYVGGLGLVEWRFRRALIAAAP